MNKNPVERKTLSKKFELTRLVLTLSAAAYLVFVIGRAVLFSPDFLSALNEFISPRAADADLEIVGNLSYVTPADPHRSGDLYLPKPTGQRRPAVIFIHGGSWKEGSRDFEKENARYIAKHGYVAFNIDYRLVGQGGEFPHDIADVKDALAFLAEHADEYAINPNEIVLFGSSSGGHMAMLAAYTPSDGELRPEAHTTSRVRAAAAVSLSGLSDLNGEYVHASGKVNVVNYLNGKTPQDSPSLYAKASPLTYGHSAVPTILVHGTDDQNVPISQSTMMAAVLRKNGIRVEIVPVQGGGHWFGPVTRDLVLSRVVVFLNKQWRVRS
jgi:acetyl esterase/lipase